MATKTEEEKKEKLIPILLLFGLGGLVAWLTRKPGIDPTKAILYGVVTDADTGAGIADIQVNCDGYTATTNENGDYTIINIEPGSYTVTFTDPFGRYQPQTV